MITGILLTIPAGALCGLLGATLRWKLIPTMVVGSLASMTIASACTFLGLP